MIPERPMRRAYCRRVSSGQHDRCPPSAVNFFSRLSKTSGKTVVFAWFIYSRIAVSVALVCAHYSEFEMAQPHGPQPAGDNLDAIKLGASLPKQSSRMEDEPFGNHLQAEVHFRNDANGKPHLTSKDVGRIFSADASSPGATTFPNPSPLPLPA